MMAGGMLGRKINQKLTLAVKVVLVKGRAKVNSFDDIFANAHDRLLGLGR